MVFSSKHRLAVTYSQRAEMETGGYRKSLRGKGRGRWTLAKPTQKGWGKPTLAWGRPG